MKFSSVFCAVTTLNYVLRLLNTLSYNKMNWIRLKHTTCESGG